MLLHFEGLCTQKYNVTLKLLLSPYKKVLISEMKLWHSNSALSTWNLRSRRLNWSMSTKCRNLPSNLYCKDLCRDPYLPRLSSRAALLITSEVYTYLKKSRKQKYFVTFHILPTFQHSLTWCDESTRNKIVLNKIKRASIQPISKFASLTQITLIPLSSTCAWSTLQRFDNPRSTLKKLPA